MQGDEEEEEVKEGDDEGEEEEEGEEEDEIEGQVIHVPNVSVAVYKTAAVAWMHVSLSPGLIIV